jgi:hypothetical protein
MVSVRAKSVGALLVRTLQADYGRSRLEAAVLAERSVHWLAGLGVKQLPGQVWLSVPASRSRRYVQRHRRLVRVTAVDVGEDTEVWETYGLAAMQGRRLLRWIGEIYRQGGWASLAELAAWANLTPTALATRLRAVRELGVWLPHVGAADGDAVGPEAWLVDRYLKDGQVERWRAMFGLTVATWEGVLRRFVAAMEGCEAREEPCVIGQQIGRSAQEVEQFLAVGRKHRRKGTLWDLRAAYGKCSKAKSSEVAIEAELKEHYGFSRVAARLYHEELRELTRQLGAGRLGQGEMVFFAIHADEGPRAKLAEARHVPVRLTYFSREDLLRGPQSGSPTRVAELKFARILRYATDTRAQGALLSLPDLGVLMGIHVDAIRRQLSSHSAVVIPTRGRIKDIGRGVSHKSRIVELYLQMHTETEIVERTGHCYESVEADLREFARVVSLADRGMNAVMIRRVTGRSMALVEAYLELYRRYERPEYHFRLAQLRRVFARDDEAGEKKGAFRFHTEGITR